MSEYQLFDALTPDEYKTLKDSIAERGVLVPVEVDENNVILDGHHRVQAWEELKTEGHLIAPYPVMIRPGMTEAEKRNHVRVLNLARRQLSKAARAKVMSDMKDDGMSYRAIAEAVGVGVATAFRAVPNGTPAKTTGRDGKTYPAKQPKVSTPGVVATKGKKEQEKTTAAMRQFGLEIDGVMTAQDVDKKAKEAKKQEPKPTEPDFDSVESISTLEVNPGEWWQLGRHLLYCGDTSAPEFYSHIEGAAFAFADPPYNAGVAGWDNGFVWRHDWLIDRCDVVMVTPGIASIFDFARLTGMPYLWSVACWINNGMTRGAMGYGNWIYGAVFSKGSIYRQAQDFVQVSIKPNETSETDHKGRKPFAFVAYAVDKFSAVGNVIVDPFLGSGTTLFVAEETDRRCIGGEINPAYCKEIIERWQGITGEKAALNG